MSFPPIIIFILILSFLVFVHELGHFLSARFFGIFVEEFGLGVPPRAWGKRIGKTIYSINWLPFGGFVKIRGEDFEGYNLKDKSNFINKKPWQKSVVLIAGIVMNTILGMLLFYVSLGMNGWRSSPILLIDDYKFPYGTTVNLPNVVTFVSADAAADKAGIEFADRIVEIRYEDQSIVPASADDIRTFLADKEGRKVTVLIQNINTEEISEKTVVPEYSQEIDAPALGVGLGQAVLLQYTGVNQAFAGVLHSGNVMGYSFTALKNLVKEAFETKDVTAVSQGVAGPVGIFGAVKAVIEGGGDKVLIALLDLTAILSLSLAVMNLLPIPALDGGRLVFVLAEWATGKRPSPRLEAKAHQVGYALLLFLLAVITLKDILQLF